MLPRYPSCMDVGIVPLRSPAKAKKRLGDGFDEPTRAAIVEALIDDTFELMAMCDFLRWVVVSDDATLLERAESAGHGTATDDGTDLNAAISAGIASTQADAVLVVPGDLPLAIPDDLREILDTGLTSDVVIVPSSGDGGTNALWLSPPDVVAPRFGPSSLRAHIERAEAAGLRCTVLALDRMALDLDTAADVAAILAAGSQRKGRTLEVLRTLA